MSDHDEMATIASANLRVTHPVADMGEVEALKAEVAPVKILRKITMVEVSRHNKPDDLWMVIDSEVYDVTSFKSEHPGGAKLLQSVAGTDATKTFQKYHQFSMLTEFKASLMIGILDAEAAPANGQSKSWLSKLWRRN